MFITDSGDACVGVDFSGGDERPFARITFGQGAGNIIKVPRAGAIHPVQMDELAIAGVFNNPRGEPIA